MDRLRLPGKKQRLAAWGWGEGVSLIHLEGKVDCRQLAGALITSSGLSRSCQDSSIERIFHATVIQFRPVATSCLL